MGRGDAAASDLAQGRDIGIDGRDDRRDAAAGRDVRGRTGGDIGGDVTQRGQIDRTTGADRVTDVAFGQQFDIATSVDINGTVTHGGNISVAVRLHSTAEVAVRVDRWCIAFRRFFRGLRKTAKAWTPARPSEPSLPFLFPSRLKTHRDRDHRQKRRTQPPTKCSVP